MRHYGTGWFWWAIDEDRSMLVPPSTAYETPPLNWWHPENCPVDRISGFGCTCNREETNDAEVPPADTARQREQTGSD